MHLNTAVFDDLETLRFTHVRRTAMADAWGVYCAWSDADHCKEPMMGINIWTTAQ